MHLLITQAALCNRSFLNIWLRDKYYSLCTKLRKWHNPLCTIFALSLCCFIVMWTCTEEKRKYKKSFRTSSSRSQVALGFWIMFKCCRDVCEVFAWAGGVFIPISGCWWGPKQCISCRGSSDLQWERMERQDHKKSAYPKGESASFTLYWKCLFSKGHCSHMPLLLGIWSNSQWVQSAQSKRW